MKENIELSLDDLLELENTLYVLWELFVIKKKLVWDRYLSQTACLLCEKQEFLLDFLKNSSLFLVLKSLFDDEFWKKASLRSQNCR